MYKIVQIIYVLVLTTIIKMIIEAHILYFVMQPHGADDDSDTSQLVDELLGDHNIPFDMQNWRRDGDPNHEQHELDQRIKVIQPVILF